MDIVSCITIICSIAMALLHIWQDGQPARTQEAAYEETQRGRQDIKAAAGGDPAALLAIDQRIDGLSAPAGAGSAVGQHNAGDLLRELQDCTGASILPGV